MSSRLFNEVKGFTRYLFRKMENQGLSEGSLNNSHRETHALRRKPAPAKLQKCTIAFLESCLQDPIIRNRMDVARAEGPLKRGTFFVLANEGRADPGFLVFLNGQPPVYVQYKRSGVFCATLRMRVSGHVSEGGGSIMIATLDDVCHSLRLEDVWVWRGQKLWDSQSFTQRRERLDEFVKHHWIPDARLMGAVVTTVANPISLDEFSVKKEFQGVASLEFIPDTPGKRRMIVMLDDGRRNHGAQLHTVREEAPKNTIVKTATPASALVSAPVPTTEQLRRVRALAVDKLPDVYDLFGEDGLPISRASIQQMAVSQQVKSEAKDKKDGVWVSARWRSEFGGYEIVGVA